MTAAKKTASAKGPKLGQARANQSVKYSDTTVPKGKKMPSAKEEAAAATAAAKTAKLNADKIKEAKSAASGADHVVIKTESGLTVTIPKTRFVGPLAKLAVVGGSFKAVQAYMAENKPKAQMAAGISGRDAPQTAKAIADQNRAKAVPAKATAKTAKIAVTKGDDSRKITAVAPNTKKGASRERFAKYKVGMTIAQALAAGVTRGDIKWDSERSLITLSA